VILGVSPETGKFEEKPRMTIPEPELERVTGDPGRHPQPESIAIAPDLTLLIGDEAAGKTATIASYAWHP
jgi:hypothetical protein